MENRDIEQAWRYHNLTKHSPASVRRSGRILDWQNQPLLAKIYPAIAPLPLPPPELRTGFPALSAIAAVSAPRQERTPTLEELSHLLYFSAGITKRRKYPGGEMEFRAASCTGALYEIELYLVCSELPDLPAGVYHFAPQDMGLRCLRQGDFREFVTRAAGGSEHVRTAPVIVVSTGTYWRNAWKYQARTYRHFGWDNGTIFANMVTAAAALALPAALVCGFVDADINRLLALDTAREVSLSLVCVGALSSAPPPSPPVEELRLETVPLSPEEIDYPEMREIHAASSLSSSEEVTSWCSAAPSPQQSVSGVASPLEPLTGDDMPKDSVEDVILRRGSSREFRREPISFAALSTVLDRSMRGVEADFLQAGERLNDPYLIVHAVDGLKPGVYYLRPDRTLELLRGGEFRKQAAFLGLDQQLPGDASVAIFFLANLHECLVRFGNRGYRLAQLEAGILGGKMYLAAYAQRLGATGLTFYDDEAARFFLPHSNGKNAIFLMAIGRGVRSRL